MEPEYKMSLPDPSKYCDVNADTKFNGTTLSCLNDYLLKNRKDLDENVKRLYDENFLQFYRVSPTDEGCFVKSRCHAEMKKTVSYEIDVALDNAGDVIEAQCECAAGMGPHAHCKHVCTVLYGALMFQKKRTIKTEETCTQKLQTFHRCKKFIGSPVKASDLDIPGCDEVANIDDFDPRPERFVDGDGYRDQFRNTWFNFADMESVPIFQNFKPANACGVAHDHDYLEHSPEDNFLKAINVLSISQDQITDIESRTMGQHQNELWRDERAKRMTSSVFGRICKATERTDRDKLAKALINTREVKSAPLEHGRKHERIAIQHFMEDTGCAVSPSGLVVSHDLPFLACSPDGVIDREHIVEVKCPYVSREKMISSTTVPYLQQSGETFMLDKTHEYYYQIQGQLFCTGANECTLVVCTASNMKVKDIVYISIHRNEKFILEMIEQLKTFFNSHFKPALLEKHFYKPYYG